ncbi:MAG: sugar transferase, partial [Flavobacteriaceae bacterium]|nr:sugar transferase [Flavobacteriaceae bacterium]
VETDKDIIGRVKFDIFYIENWSLLLDLKIIFKTAINAVKGEEKAY